MKLNNSVLKSVRSVFDRERCKFCFQNGFSYCPMSFYEFHLNMLVCVGVTILLMHVQVTQTVTFLPRLSIVVIPSIMHGLPFNFHIATHFSLRVLLFINTKYVFLSCLIHVQSTSIFNLSCQVTRTSAFTYAIVS